MFIFKLAEIEYFNIKSKIFNTMEKYETFNCFDWSELPDDAIENIYVFLNRRDQANMSLVCRNWYKEYSSPKPWKRLEFYYPFLESNKEPYAEVVFARRFGYMCHYLEICFEIYEDTLVDPILVPSSTPLNQLKLFLEVLTLKSQVQCISFIDMSDFLCLHDGAACTDVYQVVQNFMRSQKNLRCVEFRNSLLKKAEEAEILNIIIENNYKTLKALRFYDSCDYDSENLFTNFTLDECLSFHVFMNLKILSIDYTQLFEKLMVVIYECRDRVEMRGKKGHLGHITLYYESPFDLVGTVVPVVWEYFKYILPNLTVELICKVFDNFTFPKIVVPQMPLRTLRLSMDIPDDEDEGIGPLLHHLMSCGINKYLEVLGIRGNIFPNISAYLINITDIFPEMEELELSFNHPVTELDTLFNSWIERTSAKLFVEITVRKVETEEEERFYTYISDFYAPRLQAVGIKLSIEPLLYEV